ncbi:chromosome transmission fidelity protein 18 homolog isoform X2 [Octopus bimaculoides]|uniref:chromosome transmission fidelity protein 18 homolog isoform X2 n=1 Tax=Octopus bimaculoides TaxID=37653 RepID=UPI00071D343C|nr:chromosome transmission fidelity protein 18 homolog isoform X2 [Octopus bimaculoides]|eukprot:XP_014779252.1 PREDICTED: chromosome transmission fidelity protein 18 homolog isoform X2 [Octopus bimaculoides]
MDEFELMYADEMQAMDDLEVPEITAPASRRFLNFNSGDTQKNKEIPPDKALNLSSEFTEIDPLSPDTIINEQLRNGQSKRVLEFPSEDEMEEILASGAEQSENGKHCDINGKATSPNNAVPSAKRQKLMPGTTSGNFDVEPTIWHDVLDDDFCTETEALRQKTRNSQEYQQTQSQDAKKQRQRVSFSIPKTNFFSVTSSDGTRAYMRMRSCETLEAEATRVINTKNSLQLLDEPFSRLMEKINLEKAIKISEEINNLDSATEGGSVGSGQTHTDAEGVSGEEMEAQSVRVDDIHNEERPTTGGNEDNLWVDKYAPRSYAELLSEENINRSLLHWLKLWDHVVFNRPIKMNHKKADVKTNVHFNKKKQQQMVSEELDKQNRPLQKIVLLNGAPGLGKTTLAHVIAKHAGYNVVEMNASDDRSEEVVKTKIESAILMKSVVESDPRPNCLIIDEIDGAPQAAINVLLQLAKEGQTGKKKEKGLLLRPIICICNDMYVPSLRQLRPVALIFTFPPTDSSRLAGRLYQVSRWETLKAEMNALMALCEKTSNDIRSCLNTLQFVQRQKQEFNLRLVNSMHIGQKDVQRSLFSVWYDVFRMPRLKKSKYLTVQDLQTLATNVQPNTTPTARFQNILQSTYAAGEFDKILHGLFQNYLEVKFKDPKMGGINMALDWLGFVDEINCYIHSNQDYTMMQYRPYLCVVFHFMFASNTHPKILYPHQNTEMFFKKTRTENLISSLLSDVHPSVRKYLHFSSIIQEVIHPLMSILQPALRPVNMQLYSNREKECLRQLIITMVAYNMTYQQEKSADGQYNYVLEPNIEEVVKFPGMKQQKQLTYATKQMIAREIAAEKMRMADKSSSVQIRNENTTMTTTTTTGVIPNHRQKLVPQSVGLKEHTERDFFGRIIKQSAPSSQVDPTDVVKEKNPLMKVIWFRFKEGFSNAVRRQVKVQDFL